MLRILMTRRLSRPRLYFDIWQLGKWRANWCSPRAIDDVHTTKARTPESFLHISVPVFTSSAGPLPPVSGRDTISHSSLYLYIFIVFVIFSSLLLQFKAPSGVYMVYCLRRACYVEPVSDRATILVTITSTFGSWWKTYYVAEKPASYTIRIYPFFRALIWAFRKQLDCGIPNCHIASMLRRNSQRWSRMQPIFKNVKKPKVGNEEYYELFTD